jgi:hypothetical protein
MRNTVVTTLTYNALTKLSSEQPVSSVLVEATALIGLFQGQG